jgi:hypothetical protein
MSKRWRTLFVIGLTATGLSGLLAGCGKFKSQEREPWRREAELACMRSKQIKASDYIRQVKPIDGNYTCGADFPLKVAALTNETTASIPGQGGELVTGITPEATLVCPMVVTLDRFNAEVIQQAAMARFGQPVTEMKTMGSYSCRTQNNQRGARLSEHGFANAIDISGFRLADGRVITVVKDWKSGSYEAQAFLRDVHRGACQFFSTVIGPGGDMFHYDHIHVDMARHGIKGNRSVCKPVPRPVDPPMVQTPNEQAPFARDPSAMAATTQFRAAQLPPSQLPPGVQPAPRVAASPFSRPLPPQNLSRPPAAPLYSQPRPAAQQPADDTDDFDPSKFDLPDEPEESMRQ